MNVQNLNVGIRGPRYAPSNQGNVRLTANGKIYVSVPRPVLIVNETSLDEPATVPVETKEPPIEPKAEPAKKKGRRRRKSALRELPEN